MTMVLRDQSVQNFPLPLFAEFIKPGCAAYTDFTTKLTDISLVGIGSVLGMSSVIIRIEEGLGLFKIAEEMCYIESWDGVRVVDIVKVGKDQTKEA
jgi:coenzyme F420-reducing hydrogenase beta subunit